MKVQRYYPLSTSSALVAFTYVSNLDWSPHSLFVNYPFPPHCFAFSFNLRESDVFKDRLCPQDSHFSISVITL